MEKEFLIAEYNALRKEILARVVLMHHQLGFAIALWVIGLAGGAWIILQGFDVHLIRALLFAYVFVFALLTFNYQANQMTMGIVARYLSEVLAPKLQGSSADKGWESFYLEKRARFRSISALKVAALAMPLMAPYIALGATAEIPLGAGELSLLVLDALTLLFVLYNFRYKFPQSSEKHRA